MWKAVEEMIVWVRHVRFDSHCIPHFYILGDPIGFIRTVFSGNAASVFLVLLPYNYPALFTLLVDIARVYQTSGQNITSSDGSWQFQWKGMPSTWRENFSSYVSGCPIYYHTALRKALSKYNLQDMVADVQDFGRNYQVRASPHLLSG